MKRPSAWICLLLTTLAAPAFAQQRLFVRTSDAVVELDPRSASLGTLVRRFPLPSPVAGSDLKAGAVSLAGGQFLAWAATEWPNYAVVLLNTNSGAVHHFTFADFVPTAVLGSDGNSRLLVFGANYSSGRKVVLVADARSGSTRFVDVGGITEGPLFAYGPVQYIAYAHGSDLLFVAKRRGVGADTYHDIDVIHASTGTLVKTLDIWPASAAVLFTNADGTRLYVNARVAFDVATGTQFASNPSDPIAGSVAFDEHRNRLLAHFWLPDTANPEILPLRGISAFSADSLQLTGRVQVPELPLPAPTLTTAPGLTQEIDFSGASATLFVLQAVEVRHKNYVYECHESQLIALDADSGRLRQTVSTTDALRQGACGADLVRVTEPLPPTAGSAEVAGRRVTLKWQAPFGATHYELEVSTAPGLANVGSITVNEPQLVVDGVPPGVYYVRVRAINTIGKSEASKQIQVAVQ